MMANTTKTSWRLQEIVAHSSHVSVLALGKTSGRLVATGGEDCRVNIWAVNKPNCIMSLTGHSHPVECVQFSCSEEQVVAGSRTGALRIWDLEAAKILRTLVGHKANIRSLDFHPFGEYLASGSVDTNIKLWDVRRKGCVFRYKGHTQTVRCLAFSPDGKWLASSSDDSTVKLWDLTAGKMITEFTAHTGAVNAVQFHPNEYLLASGSSDGTIKLWDLEKFQMIGSSEDDTGPVRCIAFDPEGCCLFSGSQDTLRVFGWEPDRCFDLVSVGWGKVADLAVCNDQLIGVSCHLTNISSYVVDLNGVKKSGSAIQDDKPVARPKGTSMRRSYELPLNTCSGQRVKRSSDSGRRSPVEGRRSPSSEEEREEEREEESAAEIRNAEDYKEIFQPKSAISRSPPKKSEPFPAPLDDESFPVKLGLTAETRTALPNKLALGQLKNLPMASSPPVVRVEPTVATTRPPPLATPMLRPPPLATAVARPSPVATSVPRPIPVEMPSARSLPVAPPVAQPVPAIAPRQSKPEPVVIFSSRNEPIGLNVGDFLPSPRSSEPAALNEEDALAQIHKGHQTMRVMLTGRNQNLSNVRASWTSVDVKTSLDSAVAINDLSIVVDILNIVNLKPSIWKLDLCTSVLPLIEELLQSKYESYIQTGCTSLKLILKRFWPLISDTLTAPPSVGVDITREERHQKCKACYKLLKGLSGMVKTKAGQVGRNGSAFQELQLLLDPLDY